MPTLTLDRTLRTIPFVGSVVATNDHEGSAYVPQDNSLWLADDDGQAIYEVNARTGALKRRIRGHQFAVVRRLGGSVRAGISRTAEIQALAYDPTKDALFAFSGTCCPANIQSTAFRLTRTSGRLELDSYQPLPGGIQVEAAAWNPGDGRVYIGGDNNLWSHSYATNNVGSTITLPGISNIYGMDFTYDGRDLFIARPRTTITRVNWASRSIVPGWDLDVAPLGVLDARAVEVVGEHLWVSDGSDLRVPGDPLSHALFVIDVGGSAVPPGVNLVGNPEFERNLRGWDTLTDAGVSLTRARGGRDGAWAARVTRTKGRGAIRLAGVPGWVDTSTSGTYTGSLWVRSTKPSGMLQLRLLERNGKRTLRQAVARVELTGKWQRVTASLAPRAVGRSSIDLVAVVERARPGTSFDADGARLTVS